MNVVLIYSDTMRRDHLGAYGNAWIKTPNLDRLASQSVVFDRAYTSSFPTVPNRLDVLTGASPFPTSSGRRCRPTRSRSAPSSRRTASSR